MNLLLHTGHWKFFSPVCVLEYQKYIIVIFLSNKIYIEPVYKIIIYQFCCICATQKAFHFVVVNQCGQPIGGDDQDLLRDKNAFTECSVSNCIPLYPTINWPFVTEDNSGRLRSLNSFSDGPPRPHIGLCCHLICRASSSHTSYLICSFHIF